MFWKNLRKKATKCYGCSKFSRDKLEDVSTKHIINHICHYKDELQDLKAMKYDGVDNWVTDKRTDILAKVRGSGLRALIRNVVAYQKMMAA